MSTTVACKTCDREIDADSKFCIYCGRPQVPGVRRGKPTKLERAIASTPLPLEIIAFLVFAAIAVSVLWSMYGKVGLEGHAPPPPPQPKFVPKPPPKAPATGPAAQVPERQSKSPQAPPQAAAQKARAQPTVTRWNEDGTDARAMLARVKSQHPNWQTTYQTAGKRFFVVSGYEGDQIFYQKTLIRGGKAHSFLMKYPKSEKGKWRKANEALEREFR
jgi:hypothetical protein